ncbi:MAG: folate-binding protein YgfZ [Pararhodobacter sp.]|nr:folate-binding protein YgfZ [Pararhodobacter sp.]
MNQSLPSAAEPPALDAAAQCAPVRGRALFRITGPDRLAFLQGMVTNDVNRLPEKNILYAALLSPQGKYLADFFLVAQGDAVLLDTDAALSDDLERRLSLYKLRSKVEIARADLPVTRGIGPAPAGALADPRHGDMGWLLYGAALSQGEAVDWDARRVAAGVPETGSELIPGESFILEYSFERLGGVDFRKGCYVGQEVTARMRHKSELRKGLAVVEIEGDAGPGEEITTEKGRPAGRLGTVAGNRALAWLRLDRADGELAAGKARLRMIERRD